MPIQAKTKDDKLELRIYDAIGPEWAGMVSAQSVLAAIDDAGDVSEITVKINSPGGSAFDGITVHNALKTHPAKVVTIAEGLAASAASLIFMAGNERHVHENAFLVVHRASGIAMGNAKDMQAVARDLESLDNSIAQTYASITGLDAGDVMATMDEDMLMNAQDALNDGYATEVIDGQVPTMTFDRRFLNNLPPEITERFGQRANPEPKEPDMTPEQFKAKHKDVVDGWLNDEAAAAYSNAKDDAKAMIEACGGDKEAAMTAWLEGKSIEDARNERSQTIEQRLAAIEEENARLKAQNEELQNGADALQLNPQASVENDTPSEEDDKRAKAFAEAKKLKSDSARRACLNRAGYDIADFDFND